MAEVIVMPALGNSVESCLVTEWLVDVGAEVDENTLVCAIETDKSSMEVPAGVAGVVLARLVQEGDDVPVKEPILVVGAAGEAVDPALLSGASGASDAPGTSGPTDTTGTVADTSQPQGELPTESSSANATPAVAVVEANGEAAAISPRARGLAMTQGIAADRLQGSGPKGRVIERDVKAAAAAGPGLTSGARQGATDFLPGQTGSGIGGRVTIADLQQAGGQAQLSQSSQTQAASASANTASNVAPDYPGTFQDQPLKGVRKVIADRMMSSLQNAAQLTLTATANADGLLALRRKLKNAPENLGLNGVTIGDLIGFATVKTLQQYPVLNAHLTDGVIRSFDSVHLGFAVDTPRGLLVPTVRCAETMTLRQFSDASKVVAHSAIDGSIAPDLLSGGTFTVSNLGAFGIESFTPVLNEPQTGILGVGTITPRAKVNADGSVGVENRLWLSLTMDHRAYDGADGARFLKDLVAAIANIDLIVMG